MTDVVEYSFSYDSLGRLASITDTDANVTTIERDGNGNPMAVIGPYGDRTELGVDAHGYLSRVTNPAGEAVLFQTTADGLLTRRTDSGGGVHNFTYGAFGSIERRRRPGRQLHQADDTDNADGYTVTTSTASGLSSTYQVQYLPAGGERWTTTNFCTCGNAIGTTVTLKGTDGSRTITAPDGTVTSYVLGPDPRFGMMAPITTSMTVTTPAGLKNTVTTTRTVTLSDPTNPLSLATQTDIVTENGQKYTTVYDASTRTITSTSPEGRTSTTTLDAKGRVVNGDPGHRPCQLHLRQSWPAVHDNPGQPHLDVHLRRSREPPRRDTSRGQPRITRTTPLGE